MNFEFSNSKFYDVNIVLFYYFTGLVLTVFTDGNTSIQKHGKWIRKQVT